MAGERCQVCGGKVVNGRCSLCGMPYRNDEVLYHLNEPREVHYKHASAKVRDMMRQYGQTADPTTQHNGKAGRNTNVSRNTNAGRNTGVNRNTNVNRNMNASRNTNAGRNTDLNRNPTGSRNTGAAAAGRKTAAAGNTRNKTTVDMNRTGVSDQGKKQQKNSGAGWIIWIIVTLAILFPKLWDFLANRIGTNL